MEQDFSGLIRTNSNCVGCNKCFRTCSCKGSLVASKSEEGNNVVHVDSTKCIGCCACFDICRHNAREYVDDTEEFFQALEQGEQISLLIAPSFFANYANEYRDILRTLKCLGVKQIINVAFGADITNWGYINYIQNNDFFGGISQPCPSVVSFIEKYTPELIPKLFPIQSPMMCAAIYAKNEMKITDKFAFIGPCVEKKEEQMSKRGKGYISYNVTYVNLMKYIRENNFDNNKNKGKIGNKEKESNIGKESYIGKDGKIVKDNNMENNNYIGRDNNLYIEDIENYIEDGIGTIFPISGGLKENLEWYLGTENLIHHIDGKKTLYSKILQHRDALKNEEHPYLLFDALNCTNGCCNGPAAENNKSLAQDQLIDMYNLKRNMYKSDLMTSYMKLTPKERLDKLNERFADLDLQDYMCTYTDFSKEVAFALPSEIELQEIYIEMNKVTEESIEICCGACGYDTCKEMAIAIYNGFNHKENCIYYIRDEVEIERDKVRKAEIYHELALFDMHTGLYNRNAYYEWLSGCKEYMNCTVIMYDLNFLKQCNDLYGHDCGDLYIKEAAYKIKKTFEDIGTSYRVGGDEFITIIEHTNLDILQEKIKYFTTISDNFTMYNVEIPLGISMGYATYDSIIDEDIKSTEKRADVMMYQCKKSKKL